MPEDAPLKQVQIGVPLPADQELLGIVTIRRGPDGKLYATGHGIPGTAQPSSVALANLLRWMADAYDIESLSEVPNG